MKHRTMKQIPNEDRPYERCLREGAQALSDAELLSIVIRTGCKEQNSLEVATKILALNYPQEGILGLLHLSLPELTSVKGIGTVKAVQLLCIGELSKRIWKRKSVKRGAMFREPGEIAGFYQEDMRHREQEQFYVMFFNTRQELIRDVLMSQGTVNASLVSPREVLIEALRSQAVSMILIHNHPSGNPEPSREDVLLTKRISEAGSVIGIRTLDHIIIGDVSYFSFKERGLL